jgi:hypothetical protein
VASRPTRLASCARVARASGSGSARGGRATCPPEWSLRDRQPSLGCVHHVLSSPLLHVALASATGSANASSVTCMVWGSRLTRRPAQMPQSEQAALSAADLRTSARCLLLLTPPRRCTAPCHAHFGSGAGSTCWTCAASQVTRPQPACTNVLGAGAWLFWATRPRSKCGARTRAAARPWQRALPARLLRASIPGVSTGKGARTRGGRPAPRALAQ